MLIRLPTNCAIWLNMTINGCWMLCRRRMFQIGMVKWLQLGKDPPFLDINAIPHFLTKEVNMLIIPGTNHTVFRDGSQELIILFILIWTS